MDSQQEIKQVEVNQEQVIHPPEQEQHQEQKINEHIKVDEPQQNEQKIQNEDDNKEIQEQVIQNVFEAIQQIPEHKEHQQKENSEIQQKTHENENIHKQESPIKENHEEIKQAQQDIEAHQQKIDQQVEVQNIQKEQIVHQNEEIHEKVNENQFAQSTFEHVEPQQQNQHKDQSIQQHDIKQEQQQIQVEHKKENIEIDQKHEIPVIPKEQEQHQVVNHEQQKPEQFEESAYEQIPEVQQHQIELPQQQHHEVVPPVEGIIQQDLEEKQVQQLEVSQNDQKKHDTQFEESTYEQIHVQQQQIQPEDNQIQFEEKQIQQSVNSENNDAVFLSSTQEQVQIVSFTNEQEQHQQFAIEINDTTLHQQQHLVEEIHKETQNISVPSKSPSSEPEFIMPTLHIQVPNQVQAPPIVDEEEKQVEQNNKEEGCIVDETDKSQKSEPKKIPPPNMEIDQKSQLVVQFQKSLDEATFLKNQGNVQFQQKNYQKAIEQYNLAAGLCDPYYLMQCPDEILVSFKKLRINLLSNLCACYLNIGDSNTCITHANLVIQLDSQNMKAWYRRAMAYQQKQDYEEAWRDIDQAWNLVKNTTQDIEIFEKRKEIRGLLKESNKESQLLYKTMLNSAANPTEKTNQTKTTDSKLVASDIQTPQQKPTETEGNLMFSSIIWKTTASALLASSMTRFILEDKLDSRTGMIETLVLSSTTASALLFPKSWQKFGFATVTAGFLAFVLFRKQTK